MTTAAVDRNTGNLVRREAPKFAMAARSPGVVRTPRAILV